MIEITKTEVFGFDAAIRGLRNPMNSWDKSDSGYSHKNFTIGSNDLALAKKLVKAGSDHRKFMRMIHVQADVLAPIYFWKQFDQYKVATTTNSTSTMHTIHKKEFTIDDFSTEGMHHHIYECVKALVKLLNACRADFLETKDKAYWYSIIQLLPSSYNQLRTIDLNYEVLLNIYHARKNHKLDEWHTFCDWIYLLPYMSEFLEIADV